MAANSEKMKELFQDQAFLEELFSKESAEDAQALLKERGVEMTVEELNQFRKTLMDRMEGGGGELSEDDLENVAGGGVSEFFDIFADVVKIVEDVPNMAKTIGNFFRRW